jgi:hypothetical protein
VRATTALTARALATRHRQGAEKLAGDAFDVDDRAEDGDRGQRRRDHGGLHLFCAAGGGLSRAEPELVVAEHVLHDDDGIVHTGARRRAPATERHDVEGRTDRVEEREGRDDGDGDDDRDGHRRPHGRAGRRIAR